MLIKQEHELKCWPVVAQLNVTNLTQSLHYWTTCLQVFLDSKQWVSLGESGKWKAKVGLWANKIIATVFVDARDVTHQQCTYQFPKYSLCQKESAF